MVITPNNLYALDIETAPTKNDGKPYALEPYRLKQGLGKITSIAVSGPNGYSIQLDEQKDDIIEQLPGLLKGLSGKDVIAHYAVFDVAWMICASHVDLLRPIRWKDSALLAKWIYNGQKSQRDRQLFSLVALVTSHLKGHPLYEEFLDIKSQVVEAGVDYEYWLKRGRMDATVTRDLYIKLASMLPNSQSRGFILEQAAIVAVANSWVNGIHLDIEKTKILVPKIKVAKKKLAKSIDQPEAMFSSPKQLSHYLFDVLGLKPISTTPTGKPCTGKEDLMMMNHQMAGTEEGRILKTILDFKQVKTLETKFINGIQTVCAYNGSNINHSSPRMFSTYTGRFTYSSKTLNKAAFRPGIATHQLPRKGPTRDLLIAPEGYMVGELDAAAQEMRGMALESKDSCMIEGFNNNIDLHSDMAAHIAGYSYEKLQELYHDGDKEALNYRYAGKLLNLSCQYRIKNKSLAKKFFTTYGIIISDAIASSYLGMYKTKYPGVVEYWVDAVGRAKADGFAETIAGRRYQIDEWGRKTWISESSAINFPIQGFGADHKAVAISMLDRKFPEAIFILDLHDGLWYYVPEIGGKELLLDMKAYLNRLSYSELWDVDVPLPLPFDAQLGTSFGNVKEIT